LIPRSGAGWFVSNRVRAAGTVRAVVEYNLPAVKPFRLYIVLKKNGILHRCKIEKGTQLLGYLASLGNFR
jgi:hypothetical protein